MPGKLVSQADICMTLKRGATSGLGEKVTLGTI